MNQEKIGKFIAKCRKEQNLTQEELANMLGITYKAVSKWECGKGLPDASIMLDLCKILKITVNDLLSGEKVKEKEYQEKLEQNIIDTFNYSNKIVDEKNRKIAIFIMALGIFLIFNAFSIFPPESSWGSIFSVMGLLLSTFGFINLRKNKIIKKLLFGLSYFLIGLILLIVLDYNNVILNKIPPRFSYLIKTSDDIILYESPLCNVYRINRNTKNEYYIVDSKKEYTEENIPISPFNRDKSGFDTIIQFKSKYIGNNSNDGLLLDHLPLSEYGYVFQIDDENYGLTVFYHITDWYINENYYLEKSLLYNAISIFSLIDNVKEITFNFSGNTYLIKREDVINNYPNFTDIIKNEENFNKYLESKINDNEFVSEMFKTLFV